MTKKQKASIRVIDDILDEMFGPKGKGPMLPTAARGVVRRRNAEENPVLLAEQRRLIKEWNK